MRRFLCSGLAVLLTAGCSLISGPQAPATVSARKKATEQVRALATRLGADKASQKAFQDVCRTGSGKGGESLFRFTCELEQVWIEPATDAPLRTQFQHLHDRLVSEGCAPDKALGILNDLSYLDDTKARSLAIGNYGCNGVLVTVKTRDIASGLPISGITDPTSPHVITAGSLPDPADLGPQKWGFVISVHTTYQHA